MAELPCDADGMCMVCKIVPPDTDVVMCGSCASPWHMRCMNPPMESVPVGEWECPDCLPAFASPVPSAAGRAAAPPVEDSLMSMIRAIQADTSLTEDEKAKKRQELMSKGLHDNAGAKGTIANGDSKSADGKKRSATLEMMDQSLDCIFCMQLAERPVTVSPTVLDWWFYFDIISSWLDEYDRTCS
jgi:E3 ubiquitin-protein ligase UHRF1